jgi:hypothetical protein
MFSVKKNLSFLFFVCYNLYALSAAPALVLGPNVQMEAVLNVSIASVPGIPFWYAKFITSPLPGVPVLPAVRVKADPLGAVPAQMEPSICKLLPQLFSR